MKVGEVKKILSLESHIEIKEIRKRKEGKVDVNEIYIKSARKKVRCPVCNQFSSKVHDYLKPSEILYLDIVGEKTYLIVSKRRFECKNCKRSFTEDIGLTNQDGNISLKVKQKILKDFLDKNKSLKDIAISNHVSEDKARNIFLEATRNYPKVIKRLPEVLSLDEKATYTSEGMYSLIINDPIHRETLDILKSRKKEDLIDYFLKIENRKNVKAVIIDLYVPYKEVIKVCFPKAIIVVEPFHYTNHVIRALDKVGMPLVHESEEDKKSNNYYLLKNRVNKGLLLKSFSETKYELKKKEEQLEKYTQGTSKKKPKDKFNDYWYGKIKIKKNNKFIEITRVERLYQMLQLNDELLKAYNLKEDFLRIINNVKTDDVKRELKNWIKKCKESNIPEMISVAGTIDNWLEEVVNSLKNEQYNNGFTEANNNVIDKIISVSYGYKNFEFFRLRALTILRKSYSGESQKNIENGKLKK